MEFLDFEFFLGRQQEAGRVGMVVVVDEQLQRSDTVLVVEEQCRYE